MDWKTLDFIFPFVIFVYGAFTTLVLHAFLPKSAARFPLSQLWLEQLQKHRPLSALCLIMGALWSLQNLWLKDFFSL